MRKRRGRTASRQTINAAISACASRIGSLSLLGLAPFGLALLGLALSGAAIPLHGAPSAEPADTRAAMAANPGAVIEAMASHLDLEANVVVLTVQDLPITQGDVASAIRGLPVSFGSLSAQEIYRHAMDVLIRQKVMVLNARKLGLDKDPMIIREEG